MEGLKCAPRARGTVNVLRATRVCATGQVVYMRLVLSALTGRDARGYVRIMAAPTRGNACKFYATAAHRSDFAMNAMDFSSDAPFCVTLQASVRKSGDGVKIQQVASFTVRWCACIA